MNRPHPTTLAEYKAAFKYLNDQIIELKAAIGEMAEEFAELNGGYPIGTILTLKNGDKCKVFEREIRAYNGTAQDYKCYKQKKNNELFGISSLIVLPHEIASAELPTKGESK